MRWIIDRIENHLAILEQMETKEKKEVDIALLPSSIHEGAILIFQNNQYQLSNKEEDIRRKVIEERFERLRKQ